MDYVAILNHHLTFGPSVSSQTVRIEIIDDDSFEENVENFTITLSTNNTTPRLLLGAQLATVSITDNESESTLLHYAIMLIVASFQLSELDFKVHSTL